MAVRVDKTARAVKSHGVAETAPPKKKTRVDAAATLTTTRDVSPADRLRADLEILAPKKGALSFLTAAQVAKTCERLAAEGLDVETIGASAGGRPLHAITAGHGPITIAAIAAAHPDEPMGTATALHLAETLAKHPKLAALRDQITLHVVPLADPDGSAKNEGWTADTHQPLDLDSYFSHVSRSSGGDDTEYAFPKAPGGRANPQNMAVAKWMDQIEPIDHFVSLHSIFLSGGAWFLVNAEDRREVSPRLRFLIDEAKGQGLPLHDEEDSAWFGHIAPGLSNAPRATALGFSTLNSMDYVRAHCGAPLALVTELPITYAPNLSSSDPLTAKQAEAARRSHKALLTKAEDAASLGRTIQDFELTGDGKQHFARYRALVGKGHGEGRLGSGAITKGDRIYAELSLARRRSLYLGAAQQALVGAKGPDVNAVRSQVAADFEEAVQTFSKLHRLTRAPLEKQCHLQMAAVLSGVLPTLSASRA